MNVETITSRQNPLMTHLRKLASSKSFVPSQRYSPLFFPIPCAPCA